MGCVYIYIYYIYCIYFYVCVNVYDILSEIQQAQLRLGFPRICHPQQRRVGESATAESTWSPPTILADAMLRYAKSSELQDLFIISMRMIYEDMLLF